MKRRTNRIIENALSEERVFLMEHESKEIISEFKIPTTTFEIAETVDEAVSIAEKVKYPVVLKIVSPNIIHKTDVGGVRLDLRNSHEVENGFKDIVNKAKSKVPNATIVGVMIYHFSPKGVAEVIVGMTTDPQFGPTIMFGLGGVFVELLEDVSFRLLPISKREAQDMVKETRAYPVLRGYRGKPPADLNALLNILVRVSDLVDFHEEIAQIDLNPTIVYEKGAITIDSRIILKSKQGGKSLQHKDI
ncbi:MAG: acetate--CoA ligase family protein [Candidatus Hodarchaeota archaeon]